MAYMHREMTLTQGQRGATLASSPLLPQIAEADFGAAGARKLSVDSAGAEAAVGSLSSGAGAAAAAMGRPPAPMSGRLAALCAEVRGAQAAAVVLSAEGAVVALLLFVHHRPCSSR